MRDPLNRIMAIRRAHYDEAGYFARETAQVLQFDAEHVRAKKVRGHNHYTRQHGSTVRTEHEFFGEVCDSIDGIAEVLITGSHTAIADFRHYADKHRVFPQVRQDGNPAVDLISAASSLLTPH
jgi:hypothetical protein